MLNEIVNAIALKLLNDFENVEIYKDELEQGFKEPCFFIQILNPSEKQIVGNRYFRRYLFDILYFPKNGSSDIFETLDKLHNTLEYVELENGTKLRGVDRKSQKNDDTLHYFVSYESFIYKVEEEKSKMENLKLKTDIKD